MSKKSIALIVGGGIVLVVIAKLASAQAQPPPQPTVHSVRLVSNLGGTTNPAPNLYQVQAGQTFTATAITNDNYRFINWLVDGNQSTNNPIIITPTHDVVLVASFEYVKPPPTVYSVRLASNSGGTTNPIPNFYEVQHGQTFTATAIANDNYRFINWLVEGAQSTNNPITITPTHDVLLVASFEYVEPPPPSEYPLDVGITVWGTPPYFNVQDAMWEFKNFIEQNSKLRLNLTVTAHPPLESSEYRAFDTGVFPYLDNLTANTKSYLTHRVNILMFDPENRTLAFGGLAWLPPIRLAIIPLNYGAEPPWQVGMASGLTHEFLHTINVDSQSCPVLGYNESNDPGWQRCYKYLLSLLTDSDYRAIVGA